MELSALFSETVKQVPALALGSAVVAFLVKAFLKAMGEARKEYVSALKQMHDDNVAARAETREVIRENTAATRILDQSMHTLISAVNTLVKQQER